MASASQGPKHLTEDMTSPSEALHLTLRLMLIYLCTSGVIDKCDIYPAGLNREREKERRDGNWLYNPRNNIHVCKGKLCCALDRFFFFLSVEKADLWKAFIRITGFLKERHGHKREKHEMSHCLYLPFYPKTPGKHGTWLRVQYKNDKYNNNYE